MKKKTFVMALALVLVFAVAVGGVVAWLTAKTDSVTNTFTVGDINITLTETTGKIYKMVPGNDIAKDPTVTVKAGSEACYLFVKVEKSANFDAFMEYTMADDWTQLPNVSGVFYREVSAKDATAGTSFSVLAGNTVTVKKEVTKAQLEAVAVKDANQPTLKFTAYAVQKDNVANATAAWELVK